MSLPSKPTFGLSPKRLRLMKAMLQARGLGASERVRIPRRVPAEAYPLSYAQQRLWFLDQLEPGNTAYNFIITVRLTGRLDIANVSYNLSLYANRTLSNAGTMTWSATPAVYAYAAQVVKAVEEKTKAVA